MTQFDDIGSAYLAGPLMSIFGESVVYRPKGAAARAITVTVNRESQREPGTSPVVLIEAQLDETLGVTMDELNRGGDEIEFAFERPGGTASRRKIASFSDAVGGLVTLEIR